MTDREKLKEYSLKIRKKGRIRYSLENGLIFGVLIFIISNLFNLDEKSLTELYFSLRGLLTFGILIIVGFTIYWTIMWGVNERTIKRIKKQEDETNKI